MSFIAEMNNRKGKRRNVHRKNLPANSALFQAFVKVFQVEAESKDGDEFVDLKDRRVVSKELLYEDIIKNDKQCDPNIYPPETSWTDNYWKRENSQHANASGSKLKNLPMSKLERKLTAAVTQPVEASKASSMMMRMGWQGGALGKSGIGITVPVVPNVAYATKTIGFGAFTKEKQPIQRNTKKTSKPKTLEDQMSKKVKRKIQREILLTNAFKVILQFVKNPREIQILFDPKLSNGERKLIHTAVNDIISDDIVGGGETCDSEQQADLVDEILQFNNYILKTQSEGKHPQRTLCLYKEAPDYVFLVTPEDLRPGSKHETYNIDDEYDDLDKNDDEAELYNVSDDENINTKGVNISNEDDNKTTNDSLTAEDDKITEVDTKPEKDSKHIGRETKNVINQPNVEENESKVDKNGETCDENNQIKEKQLIIDKTNKTVNINCNLLTDIKVKEVSVEKKEDQTPTQNEKPLESEDISIKTDKSRCLIVKTNSTDTEKTVNSNVSDVDKENKLDAIGKIDESINKTTEDSNKQIKEDLSTAQEIENEHIDIIDTLIGYCKDFLEDNNYSELRFLGSFNDDEVGKINEFISSLHSSIMGEIDSRFISLISCMDKEKCYAEVNTDMNEGIVIFKIMKNE